MYLWYCLKGKKKDIMRGFKLIDSVDFTDKKDRLDYILTRRKEIE